MMRSVLVAMLATTLFVSCKKKPPADEGFGAAPETETAPTPAPEPAPTPAPTTAPAADPIVPSAQADAGAQNPDYVRVSAKHEPPKPDDPVIVDFQQYKVASKITSTEDLTGSSAEITIEAAKFLSGIPKRDTHLSSPDYLDVAQFPTITVKITDVKKTAGQMYEAKAEISAHGKTATWPVNFQVTESSPEHVKIKGSHAFKRSDFAVGKPVGDPTADELSAEVSLTLKKS